MRLIANICSVIVLACIVGAIVIKLFGMPDIPLLAFTVTPKGLLVFAIAVQLFGVNNTLTEMSKKSE